MRDKVIIKDNTGSIINYRSILTNVIQTIHDIDRGSADDRAELEELAKTLFAEIEALPADRASDGKTLARKTEQLLEDVREGADRDTTSGMLAMIGKAGAKVLDIAPKIPETIDAIGKIVDKFG